MRARRPRLPARILLACLLATFAVPLTAAGGQAASSSLTLTVHVGYQNAVKTGTWTPVTVDVKNSGADLEGTLEIQGAYNAQPGVPGTAAYRMAVSLPSGTTKHIRTYIVEETSGLTVTTRVVQNGRNLASQDAAGSSSTVNTMIGVLADSATAFDNFAAVHPAGLSARVVHLRTEDVADSAVVLRGFDLLAIDDFATDSLTVAQRAALADYVQSGGSLLLGTGGAWHKTLGGIPSSLLPMQPDNTSTVTASPALGGIRRVELATGALSGGQVWLADGARPLLLEKTVGAGTVLMSTFDWSQEPVAGWSGAQSLLRQILVRSAFSGSSGTNLAMGIGGGGGPAPFMQYGSGGSSMAQRSNALIPVLGNLPALDLPSLQLTGVLVLLYVLLVGPVNYLVLGALRRRALAWITVPVIAIVAAAGAYGAGVFSKGRSVQTNQVSILHLQPGWTNAYQESYTGILAPTRGDYQIGVGGEHLLISPISSNNNGFNGSTSSTIQVNVDGNSVGMPGMTAFVLRGFGTESLTSAPQLTGHLRLAGGKLTGTVENNSSIRFTDAVLIAGDSYQTLGAMKPGASASVSITPKAANPFGGQPAYTRIYPNNSYGSQPNAPSETQREGEAKTQILSLLPIGGSFKGFTAPISPVLVAWTKEPFQNVTVNGEHPLSTTETAVALTLPIEQLSAGAVPAGVISGQIVDVEGDTQQGPPMAFIVQNGSVNYEFGTTLSPGTHLTSASLVSSNPYGGKFASGPPGNSGPATPVLQGEVWDWAHSAWTQVSYQDNGTTAIPDSGINPSTGLVRLRLSSSNGSFMAGPISLAGTVR